MRKWGVVLIVLGVGAIVLPICGYQFRAVGATSGILGVPAQLVGGVLAVVGAILVILSLRAASDDAPSPVHAMSREAAIEGLQATAPLIEDILAQRPDTLSEESVRKIYPFFGEISLRADTERSSVIAESVAPRAGVRPDDVTMFVLATVKVWRAKGKL